MHEADASSRIELRNGRNEAAGRGEANMSASMMRRLTDTTWMFIVGNGMTLAFCDIGPAQGDMFGSISRSIFLGECHGAFAILLHSSE